METLQSRLPVEISINGIVDIDATYEFFESYIFIMVYGFEALNGVLKNKINAIALSKYEADRFGGLIRGLFDD